MLTQALIRDRIVLGPLPLVPIVELALSIVLTFGDGLCGTPDPRLGPHRPGQRAAPSLGRAYRSSSSGGGIRAAVQAARPRRPERTDATRPTWEPAPHRPGQRPAPSLGRPYRSSSSGGAIRPAVQGA